VAGLCELGETITKSDEKGNERALARANCLTHVGWQLAVGWLRSDDGAVCTAGRVAKVLALATINLLWHEILTRFLTDEQI
jgi:hypothetical protein